METLYPLSVDFLSVDCANACYVGGCVCNKLVATYLSYIKVATVPVIGTVCLVSR